MKNSTDLIMYGIIYLIIILVTFCIIGEEPKVDTIQKVKIVKGETNVTRK